MKYLCLVYLEGEKLHAVPDRECKSSAVGVRPASTRSNSSRSFLPTSAC